MKQMKRSQFEPNFEPEAMTSPWASGYPDVPVGWFMVLDCEGNFVCAVPPGKGEDPCNPAQMIARALNVAWENAEDDVSY